MVDGETVAEVVFKQLSAEPVPIPDAIADHSLGRILRRVTAKDPAARDATAEGLLREVEGCDLYGLRPRTGPVRIDPAPSDAATATVQFSSTPSGGRAPRLVEGERRQITALCCNLSAASTGGRAVDAEELDHVLGVEQEACAEIARRFDGHVAGALGDSVLFYFGYPTAREDDAPRAARAALAMAAEVRRRSAPLEEERKLRIDLRTGVHTGIVVSREIGDPAQSRIGFVVGSTPKLAARLAALADPGSVVVSGSTQRLLRKEFLLDASGLRLVDDSTLPVEVFALREGDPSAGVRDVPLVGREREMATLFDLWGKVRGGAGQAVLLSGEPGIGKSRLARELAERIGAEPHTWLACRATPDGVRSAFHPIIELLDRMLDPRREVKPDGKVTKLEALLSLYGFELSEAMPLFAPLLSLSLPPRWSPIDVSPQKKRELTRNAVLSLLFEMAEKEPVVLLIEDLHWADPSTVELLGQLVGEIGSARVLALFTARPEFSPPWPSTSFLPVQLGRFGRPEIEQMVAKVTAGRALPAEVMETIASRTDGVPLFVEELVLTMIEAGALAEKDGRYVLAKPLSEVAIPNTLRDSLVARLDRLGRAKETAQVASAIGREFTFELLRAVSPLGEAAAQEDLDKLVAAELVFRKRRLKNPAYIFKHALVRDAAYESMLKRSRVELHGRIAKALEDRYAQGAEGRRSSGDPGAAPRRGRRHALRRTPRHRGGDGLPRREQPRRGHGTGRAGRRVAPRAPRRRPGRRAAPRQQRGVPGPDVDAGLGLARRARARREVPGAAPRTTAIEHTISTLFALFMHYHVASDRAACRRVTDELVAFADRLGDPGLNCVVATARGVNLHAEGQFHDAEIWLQKACDLYDPARDAHQGASVGMDCRVWATAQLAWVQWGMGRTTRAFTLVDAAIDWARHLKHVPSLGLALLYLGQIQQMNGDKPGVGRTTGEILAASKRYGLPAFEGYAAAIASWAAGDLASVAMIIGILKSINCNLILSYYGSFLADLEAEAGHAAQAVAHVDTYLALCAELGEHVFEPELWRRRGLYEMRLPAPDLTVAREAFVRSQDLARAQSMFRFEAAALEDHLRLLGDSDTLRDRLAQIHESFPDLRRPKE